MTAMPIFVRRRKDAIRTVTSQTGTRPNTLDENACNCLNESRSREMAKLRCLAGGRVRCDSGGAAEALIVAAQNHRSLMVIVSPGRTGAIGGTFCRAVTPLAERLISASQR